MMIRVGQGYDIHRLVAGRRLILGGVEIPCASGLDGHSDADVLLHALGDAILGAAGLEDLGHYFPPGEEAWKDADSAHLIERIVELAAERDLYPQQCDLTLIAESPKIAPHRAAMRQRIASLLGITADAVGLKATTNEGLGAIGRGEGIAALAVVVLSSRSAT